MSWKQNWGYKFEKIRILADCDYRCLYVSHNYLFYRIEKNRVIIVGMFDEREDFMQKLFGISTTKQESIDDWDELS